MFTQKEDGGWFVGEEEGLGYTKSLTCCCQHLQMEGKQYREGEELSPASGAGSGASVMAETDRSTQRGFSGGGGLSEVWS